MECPLYRRILTTDLSENLPLPYGMCKADGRIRMNCDYETCDTFKEYTAKKPVQLPLPDDSE